ncbi:MAG: hypothetical protein HQ485_09570 [Acidobacteria bacterium]|jgi:hypothetical protein|nr:hypothetical protein [Acidobacteriota bacterium]
MVHSTVRLTPHLGSGAKMTGCPLAAVCPLLSAFTVVVLTLTLVACRDDRGALQSTTAPPAAGVTEAAASVDSGAEAILLAYRQAAGLTALDNLTSLRAAGVTFTAGDRSNRRLVIQTKLPGKFRQYEAPVDAASRQLLSIIGLNGPDGWRAGNGRLAGDGLSPDRAVRERAITQAARQNYINALAGMVPWILRGDPSLTFAAVEPASQASDLGLSVVLISSQDGPAGRLFFDPATSLPTKFVAPYQTHIRKQGGEYTLHLSDFREVEGLRVPFAMNRDDEAERSTRWSFSTYTLTPAIAPTDFAPPIR